MAKTQQPMNQSVSKLKKIHDCFQSATEQLPVYRQILPFFGALYQIEESGIFCADLHGMEERISKIPKQNGSRRPLIRREAFIVDDVLAERLLRAICDAARSQNADMKYAAAVLTGALDNEDPILRLAFSRYLRGDDAVLIDLSQDLNIDNKVLIFFLYHSTWPSLARQVQYAGEQNRINAQWPYSSCPICGSSPNLAYFSESGKRHLVCGFCRYEWPVQRVLCPHCENEDPESISYSFSEEEQAYRLYTCNRCLRYIKTVDTRKLSRDFYAPLEYLVTLHLDLQAESLGFQGGEDRYLFGG